MVNLSGSRWAPSSHHDSNGNNANSYNTLSYQQTPSATGASTSVRSDQRSRLTKTQRDLVERRSSANKFGKLIRRLRWKSRTLLFSYHRALHEREQNVVGGKIFVMELGEAEMMFKIDFFEFYVLLERVLVHLLGIFGMAVSASYSANIKSHDDGLRDEARAEANDTEPKSLREELMEQHRQKTLVGDSRMFHGYAHRFHANVLAALDVPQNPLHEILGQGQIRDYLGIAKEFRNRWKDAEEKPADEKEDGLVGSRYERMLNDLNIEEMLMVILSALDDAKPIAEAHFYHFVATVEENENLRDATMKLDAAMGDMPWEAMPDAMEWN